MTAAAFAPVRATRVDIGWVLGATIKVLWRRALALFVIGLPFIFLPNALVALLPPQLSAVSFAVGLPGLFFTGAASLLTYRELAGGRPASVGDVIGAGIRRFGSLWGVGFITGVATIIGLLLLIGPGLFLIVAWMPASTVVMVEDKSTFEALDRAWSLTRESRWRLLAVLAIGVAATVALLLLLAVAAALLIAIAGLDWGSTIGRFVMAPFIDVVTAAIVAVGGAAAYAGLRRAKEGTEGDIAHIFD